MLYYEFKGFGSRAITRPATDFKSRALEYDIIPRIDKADISALNILKESGQFTARRRLDSSRAQELAGIQRACGARKKYAERTHWLVLDWLTAIAGTLLLQGLLGLAGGLTYSDSVLTTALGGTAGSPVAVGLLAAKHLLPKQ